MSSHRFRALPLTLAGALAVSALAPGGQAQTVRVVQRDPLIRADSIRADSIRVRVRAGDTDELMRIVAALRDREEQLVRELRASSVESVAVRRQIFEELGQLSRQAFMLMSVVESQCHTESGPQPDGYIGLNLRTELDSSTGAVRFTVVESVEPGSPAQRSGLIKADTLILIGGRDVRRRLPDASGLLQPGNRVAVRVGRSGGEREVIVTVAPRPKTFTKSCGQFERVLQPLRLAAVGRFAESADSTGAREVSRVFVPQEETHFFIFGPDHIVTTATPFFAGAQFRALDEDWRAVLGVKADIAGVLVNTVAPGSAAAQSGLKSGDVITAVGNTPAGSPMALMQLLGLAERAERPAATLHVLRAKEKKTVTLRWSQR